jgi:hypothetical protein
MAIQTSGTRRRFAMLDFVAQEAPKVVTLQSLYPVGSQPPDASALYI